MKVLLVRHRYVTVIRPFQPYGMLTISAVLNALPGVEAKVFDANTVIRNYTTDQVVERIRAEAPDVLGLAINLYNARATYDLIDRLRVGMPDLPIVAGGIHTYDAIDEIMREARPDAIARGEAEIPMSLLVQAMGAERGKAALRRAARGVPGFQVLNEDGEGFADSGRGAVIDNLDDLPFVDPRQMNIEDFVSGPNDHQFNTNIVLFQRGCPYSCSFCKAEFMAGKVRQTSPAMAARHVAFLIDAIRYDHIFIADNNFTLNKKWVMGFCREIVALGLDKRVTFEIQTNIRTKIDEEILDAMRSANVSRIELGIERLTPRGWRMGEKAFDLGEMERKIKLMKAFGFEIFTNILLGFPEDDLDSVREEKAAFMSYRNYFGAIGVKIFIPIPGTALHRAADEDVREWYLKKDFLKIRTSFFQMSLFDFAAVYFVNPYRLSRRLLREIALTQAIFLTHTAVRTHPLLLVPRLAEIVLSVISLALYRIHPRLENVVFGALMTLRSRLLNVIYTKLFNRKGRHSGAAAVSSEDHAT